MAHALELQDVSKSFGHVAALSGVDLHVDAGEVLAVVGDNGAGKSTLMGVVAGLLRPDAGTILRDGDPRHFDSPADARRSGIAVVTQDLALVECLDVAANLFIGQNPRRGPFVDRRRMERESREFLATFRSTVHDVRMPIGLLSGGQRQIVALARALRTGAAIVLLDEPTAALGVRETAEVAGIVADLRERGTAVICVSHDMQFVDAVADRIQVLRLGRSVAVRATAGITPADVIGLITGATEELLHG